MTETPKISARDVSVFYGEKRAIDNVSIDIDAGVVTAFIGPSGCGKSTFLRTLNRMNDTIPGCRVEGEIRLDGEDIYTDGMDVVQLRARVGMVFQKPNPIPKSIFENVAYGPRIHGLAQTKGDLDRIVERSLVRAGLFPAAVLGMDLEDHRDHVVVIDIRDRSGEGRVPVGHGTRPLSNAAQSISARPNR